MNETARERIQELGKRMRYLLETYALETEEIAAPFMEEVRNIRKEITSYGYLVQWNAAVDLVTQKLSVEVEIFEPRQNLSPELQALYDEWFLKANQ